MNNLKKTAATIAITSAAATAGFIANDQVKQPEQVIIEVPVAGMRLDGEIFQQE